MARDLAVLTARLRAPQIDLAGYSMGAVVALLHASGNPAVRRLAIGGVGSAVIECGGVDRRGVSSESIIAALQADGEVELGGLPAQAQVFRRVADAVGADRLAMVAHAQSIHRGGVAPERITAPTLLLAGAQDPMATRPQVLVDALPDGRLQILDGDHIGALADPRFAASMVAFLGDGVGAAF
jgi:pimeloyl-ACP methyl ester carboxylesterase